MRQKSQTSNPAGSPKITDTTPRPSSPPKPQEYTRFEALTSKLVKVPKSEIDEQRKG